MSRQRRAKRDDVAYERAYKLIITAPPALKEASCARSARSVRSATTCSLRQIRCSRRWP